jgi:hypothetical protein
MGMPRREPTPEPEKASATLIFDITFFACPFDLIWFVSRRRSTTDAQFRVITGV